MAQKCDYCGENSVTEDGQYGQTYLICASCGAVAEDVTFAASTEPQSGDRRDRNLAIRTKGRLGVAGGSNKTKSKGHKQGMDTIDTLSSKLSAPAICAEEAKETYKIALRHPAIKGVHLCKKVCIAAGCLYAALRRANKPITIAAICRSMGCSAIDFSAGYRLVVRATNVQGKRAPVEDVVPCFLVDFDFGTEKAEVLKRTNDLVRLADRLWLSTGRPDSHLVHACAFLAWKSLSRDRCSTSYARFCTTMKMQNVKTTYNRAREVKSMLVELGKNIPWLDDATPATICLHLNDVLRYESSLRLDAANEGEPSNARIEEREFEKFRWKPPPKKKHSAIEETDGQPCSEEIDDEDIEQYIRSNKEVEMIKRLYKKYKPGAT